jgi:hypothetical protein
VQIAENIGDRSFAKQLAFKKVADIVAKYTALAQRRFHEQRLD